MRAPRPRSCQVCTFAGNRAQVLRCAMCNVLYEARAGVTIRAPLPSEAPLHQHQNHGQKGIGEAMAGPLL